MTCKSFLSKFDKKSKTIIFITEMIDIIKHKEVTTVYCFKYISLHNTYCFTYYLKKKKKKMQCSVDRLLLSMQYASCHFEHSLCPCLSMRAWWQTHETPPSRNKRWFIMSTVATDAQKSADAFTKPVHLMWKCFIPRRRIRIKIHAWENTREKTACSLRVGSNTTVYVINTWLHGSFCVEFKRACATLTKRKKNALWIVDSVI